MLFGMANLAENLEVRIDFTPKAFVALVVYV